MLKQILVGLLIAGIGGAIIAYAQGLTEMMGVVDWFEKNLGSTKSGYVIAGFLIVVVGFLILFGVIPLTSAVSSVASVGTGV